MKNKAKVNREYTTGELQKQINKLKEDIKLYKNKLNSFEKLLIRNKIVIPKEGEEDSDDSSFNEKIEDEDNHQEYLLSDKPYHNLKVDPIFETKEEDDIGPTIIINTDWDVENGLVGK